MPCTERYMDGDQPAERPCAGADQFPTNDGCLAGTALKKLLARIGITATPDCKCNARAAEMDARGCRWCEENIETIVGWLREEATKRRLPFMDAAGMMIVRKAIRSARSARSASGCR